MTQKKLTGFGGDGPPGVPFTTTVVPVEPGAERELT
jgi:hypothetical protein